METQQLAPNWLPHNVILLGTDASGKNHVAQLWAKKLAGLGCCLEIREGRLSASPSQASEDEKKGLFSLSAEQWFLRLFPILKPILPWLLTWLLRWDARHFKPSDQPTLIISHNALRILALCLGQRPEITKPLPISKELTKAIRQLQTVSQALVIVLDIEHQVRAQRIQQRLLKDLVDPFDRYMASDPKRSERIEECLVTLAKDQYQAVLIENNDLSDEALWTAFQNACKKAVHFAPK